MIDPFSVQKIEHFEKTEWSEDLDALFLEAEPERDPARLKRLEDKINRIWKARTSAEQFGYIEKSGMVQLLTDLRKVNGRVLQWDLSLRKD